jgi:hypothetical protein
MPTLNLFLNILNVKYPVVESYYGDAKDLTSDEGDNLLT